MHPSSNTILHILHIHFLSYSATVFTDTLRHRTEVTSGVLLPNSRSAILNRFARNVKDDNAGQQGEISQVDASSEVVFIQMY